MASSRDRTAPPGSSIANERRRFSTFHGYSVPLEVRQSGIASQFEEALDRADRLFRKIEPIFAGADFVQHFAKTENVCAGSARAFRWNVAFRSDE